MTDDERFNNPFCNELNSFLMDYEGFMAAGGFSKNTINRHYRLISSFLWFLNGYTNVQGFEGISKAYLNSKLRAYLHHNDPGGFSDSFVAFALKGFFSFIYQQHGIATTLIKKEFGL